jgi:RND superfamily putative drug exporter
MLTRLAGFIYPHRRVVLYVTVVGAVIAGVFGSSVANHLSPYGANDPATQSVQATNRFQNATDREIDPGVVALVTVGNVHTATAQNRVDQVTAQLQHGPDVASAVSYYDTHDPAMVSRDGRQTYIVAYFRPKSDSQLKDDAQQIENGFAGQRDVKLGGGLVASAQVNAQVSHDLEHAELLAFPFVFLLSLLFFRSLVAALLPPLLGGLAIVATFFALRIIAGFVDLSVFALNLTTGLGLGLAIDYSLFMVSRYREESVKSGFGAEALTRTLQTSGRTIVFSSLTIAAALASLMIFPQRFLYSMGVAGALVALLAATLAIVVLPAILGVLGPRVNALSPTWLARAANRDARPAHAGAWYRLSQIVMRRPALIAITSASFLIALGIPFFTQVKFTTVDANVLPAGATARQVNDTLNTRFPPNRGAPLDLVVGAPATSRAVTALEAQIARMPDVSAIEPGRPAGPNMSLVSVAPVQAPLSDATENLVRDVRALHVPFYLGVAGETAAYLDLEHSLAVHLPAVLAIVLVTTVVILFVMTGSVVLPIKAVIMNGLGLCAMFGILVLVFQDGNLEGLLSYRSLGALDATQPVLLFAVGFGLATDYGVFLLSRIKEARDAGASDRDAVAIGLERTGRVVTAAALLFAVALGAFSTSEIVFVKELGLGAVVAVLIDASIIRALLVPALMVLLGPLNWWAPRPLRRLHDRIGLREGGPPPPISRPAATHG